MNSFCKIIRYHFIILLFCLPVIFAKIISKCEIVFELRELGYAENELKNMVCLIDMFRAHNLDGSLPHGANDYELLQVHDHYWCNSGLHAGRGCDVQCSDLQQDDITVAAACAKTLLSHHGTEWYLSQLYCRGFKLPAHGCKHLYEK